VLKSLATEVAMRRNRSEWEKLAAEFAQSNEPRDAFCARVGVHVTTFRWWLTELRRKRRASRAGKSKALQLVPVRVREAPTAASATPIEVIVRGATLRVAIGTDIEYVATLASALSSRC
jgi:hypothetical protein